MDKNLKVERLKLAVRRVLSHYSFSEAEAEVLGEEIHSSDIISHFMGSGCSDALTYGDVQELRSALEDLD
jgi:hypothetical protein